MFALICQPAALAEIILDSRPSGWIKGSEGVTIPPPTSRSNPNQCQAGFRVKMFLQMFRAFGKDQLTGASVS